MGDLQIRDPIEASARTLAFSFSVIKFPLEIMKANMDESRYDILFKIYGDRYLVPWMILKAQVKAQSGFDPTKISAAGAQGLAQLMPTVWEKWSKKLKMENTSPFDPRSALECQAAYMGWLIDQTGSGEKALAAYKLGLGKLSQCIEEHGKEWREHLPDETAAYITRVIAYFEEYRSLNSMDSC